MSCPLRSFNDFDRVTNSDKLQQSTLGEISGGEFEDFDDPRIDPGIKAIFGEMDFIGMTPDAESRQELVEKANSDESKATQEMLRAFLDMADT